MFSFWHAVLVTCAMIVMVEPVLGEKVWAWFYRTRGKDRCTGPELQYTAQYRLDDGGQCIRNVADHDGSMWVDIDGGPGRMGCLFMYEEEECRGPTVAWEFPAQNWCFEMPHIDDRRFSSYRYVKDSCWPDREPKPESGCHIGHDGKVLVGVGEGSECNK